MAEPTQGDINKMNKILIIFLGLTVVNAFQLDATGEQELFAKNDNY